MYWQNWDKRVRCEPALLAVPDTEQELAAQVARWTRAGRRIRVAGSGHSFTPLVASNDVLVSLDKLTGLAHVDQQRQQVEVWAGTPLHQLGRLLTAQDLAQHNLGDIDIQTLAGAVSTGTHGTGTRLGSLSDQICGFTLVSADGRLHHCDRDHEPDLFAAGRVSLGTLGILTRVRLSVRPDYRLHLTVRKGTLDQCLAEAHSYADAYRNFEFFWFPGTAHTMLKFAEETDAPARPAGPTQRMLDDVLENGVFGAMSRVGRAWPSLSPTIAGLAGRFVGSMDIVDLAHRVYASKRRVRFHEMEYALPREALIPALIEIRDQIRRKRYDVFFPVECRYAAADDIWLSPAYERDSAFIAVHMYRGMPFEDYFHDMEAILRAHGGRPHWGKLHTLAAQDLAPLYPRWQDFCALREKLDPMGWFVNSYLRDLFAVRATPAAMEQQSE